MTATEPTITELSHDELVAEVERLREEVDSLGTGIRMVGAALDVLRDMAERAEAAVAQR